MKKILSGFLFAFLVSGMLYSQQDTIITNSGDKVICDIQREDQNSVTVILQNGGIEYTNTIQKAHVRQIIYGDVESPKNYLSWKDRDLMVTLNLVMPSVGLEVKLADHATLVLMYEPGFIISKYNDEPSEFNLVHQFSIAPRFYTNIRYREYKGKNTYKFSGTYISPYFLVTMESAYMEGFVTVGPLYGIQRNLGNVGHFSIDIGMGFTTSGDWNGFTPLGNIALGFAL